jgi:hypothetical protein
MSARSQRKEVRGVAVSINPAIIAVGGFEHFRAFVGKARCILASPIRVHPPVLLTCGFGMCDTFYQRVLPRCWTTKLLGTGEKALNAALCLLGRSGRVERMGRSVQ